VVTEPSDSSVGKQEEQQALGSTEPPVQAPPPLACFFFFFLRLIYFMCMGVCLHVCLCTTCTPGSHRDQKRVSDLLELHLRTILSLHVDVGN
jgi:hypothetical protein